MANIPEDIMVNILSCLPVKSLLRFRCISKSWCTLISDPGFAKSHLKRRYEKHNVDYTDHHTILTSWSSEFRSMNYDASIGSYQENNLHAGFLPIGSIRYEALGSCNGLIYLFRNTHHQIIWNPSTRDYKVLSKPLNLPLSYFCGFGYDPSINDYKVVVGYILDCVSTCTIYAEVLTMKSNTWKANYWKWVPGVGNMFTLSNGAIPLNGALHWQQLRDGGEFIMSFDLATEKFMELTQLPPSAKKISLYPKDLGVLQDCLCLCRTSFDENIEEVWVMKEYGVSSSWSKLFSVVIEPDTYHFKHHYMPLCILINGDVVMDSNGSKLVIYSPENKTFRCIREARAEGFHKLKSVLYVESLVSVN